MTNNPTIDGVSRELLEAAWAALMQKGQVIKALQMRDLLDAPVVERQPDAWPKLQSPAMVGCTRFGKGVSARLVVEAAQRHYSYEVTPDKEAQRMMRVAEFAAALNPPEVAALQSTIAQLQARIAELESGRGEPVKWMREGPDGTEYCDAPFTTDWTPLYTAPPAPVAVVLPERATDSNCAEIMQRIGLYGRVNVWHGGKIWNACLDATAALNEVKK